MHINNSTHLCTHHEFQVSFNPVDSTVVNCIGDSVFKFLKV